MANSSDFWYTNLIKRISRDIIADCIARNIPIADKAKPVDVNLLIGTFVLSPSLGVIVLYYRTDW